MVCPGLPRELHNAEGYKKVAEEFNKVGEIMKKRGTDATLPQSRNRIRKIRQKAGIRDPF